MLLTDLFVAAPEDAPTYETLSDAGDLPAERFERLQFTGFSGLEFETLWALARDERWDPDQHALTTVEEAEDGTTWLFRFPPAFVALLAELDALSQARLRVAWSRAVEGRVTPDEAGAVLRGAAELASKARERGRGLYLWGTM